MGYKFKLTKSQLAKEYSVKQQTAIQIAEKYNVCQACIRYWLKKYKIPPQNYQHLSFEDLSGRKFGLLTVLKRMPHKKGQCTRWLCKCRCGKTSVVPRSSLVNGLTTSCGCKRREMMFKGIGNLSLSYWNRVISGARKRKLIVNISIENAWKKYMKQNKKCALSGVSIDIVRDYTKEHKLHTASLDRKNYKIGYTKSNIQWVHRDVNMAKRRMSDKDFVAMCKRVANHARKTN